MLTASSSLSLGGSSLLICLSPLRFFGAGSRWSVGRFVILCLGAYACKQKQPAYEELLRHLNVWQD